MSRRNDDASRAHGLDEHPGYLVFCIKELSCLIESGAITPNQKTALHAAIIALRKQFKDRALERKFADRIPDYQGAVTQPSCVGTEKGGTASVYKYFDKNGILIYVGITTRGIARNRQHNKSREWWQFVTHQQIVHFSSRALAHECEVQLIEQFRPPFNKQHNKDYVAARRFYLDMTEGRALPPPALQKTLNRAEKEVS